MLMTDYKGPGKKTTSIRPPKEWEETEIRQLTELLEEYREASGLFILPRKCIINKNIRIKYQ